MIVLRRQVYHCDGPTIKNATVCIEENNEVRTPRRHTLP